MTGDRQLSEDLLQDTFMSALRNAVQYDKNRSFLSWLFGIAHKRAIDYFRHVKVENDNVHNTERSMGTRLDAPDSVLDKSNIRGVIMEALEQLEPLQREVFMMREVGDMSFKDIARLTNSPLNTALGRMRLALKNIRKELEKRGIHGVQ
jgi:RNA polymerase sigma-70 factor (ECF subfamily)